MELIGIYIEESMELIGIHKEELMEFLGIYRGIYGVDRDI